jgi:hypothetical protein
MLPIKAPKVGIEHKSAGAAGPREVIDAIELARRWNLPASWVREQTRTRAGDPLPCIRFGRYVRFEWGSPQLAAWFERRRT